MWNKIIIAFFIFGCWAKFVPGILGFLAFNIWYVLVLFWMILNGLGVLNFFFNKNAGSRKLQNKIDDDMESRWMVYNFMAVVSYAAADCWGIAMGFLLTSCFFMLIIIGVKNYNDKKKKNK